jgi:hypothetical protein
MKTALTMAALAFAAAGPATARAQMGGPPREQAKDARAAQERTADQQQQQRAPRETVTAMLDGRKVAVEYGRPALAGRTLDQLMAKLGPDRVWRAGENQVTTLTTESDVLIGGKRVPAGKYSLYLYLPEGGDWHLLLNSDPGIPLKEIYAAAPPNLAGELWPRLDGYDKVSATEVLRVPLKRSAAPEPMDRFLIGLAPAKDGASSISFAWADQAWTTDVKAVK